MQVPGRAVSTRRRARDAAAAGGVFFAAFPFIIFIIVIKYETNWGKSNAQACECDSAQGETGSADARNGGCEHAFYGGGGVGAGGARGRGRGAVSTAFMAGVELVRRGHGVPVGSLTQLGTIRLGQRTDGRTPKIKDFVQLAKLDDIVFGGWDVFSDD